MNAGSGVTAALRVREFRALWSAELLSVGGGQLTRVRSPSSRTGAGQSGSPPPG